MNVFIEERKDKSFCGKMTDAAVRTQKICDKLPFGKLITIYALADRLCLKKSTVDHCAREVPGYTILYRVSGRWRRLFGSKKTIAKLEKEQADE